MKKILITLFLVSIGIVLGFSYAEAISGPCSDCHTMHNSQNGSVIDTTPNDQLLNDDCIGCHSATTNVLITADNAPVVLRIGVVPAAINAGGDFYWVNNGTDSMGHNVQQAPSNQTDGDLTGDPPGWQQNYSDSFGTIESKDLSIGGGSADWANSNLTCAGSYGCHGAQDTASNLGGIQGAHHGNTQGTSTVATDANTIGNSFRFLSKVKGLEDGDWEGASSSATDHNEYLGEIINSGRQWDSSGNVGTFASPTISMFCAKCHGQFHAAIDADNTGTQPWRRHPTDIALSNGPEASLYNTSTGSTLGVYNPDVPVGRTSIPTSSSSSITVATDSVICLSCHRAHGSAYPDLLRFNYDTMIAGSSNTGGCFVCHVNKNTVNP